MTSILTKQRNGSKLWIKSWTKLDPTGPRSSWNNFPTVPNGPASNFRSASPTDYVNTIPAEDEVPYPGDRALERRIKSIIRWNAMAMVSRQNKHDHGIGGHISTYQSLATLLEVGFNHFFHASYGDQPGDFIYFQGHASPGVYSRAFVEGRLSEKHLENFRHELRDEAGTLVVSASLADEGFLELPHGLHGPRAHQRDLPGAVHALSGESQPDPQDRSQSVGISRRWRDGRAGIAGRHHAGSREKLDNLIFVVNCNLQRLDGPVRGNGQIVRELEVRIPRRRMERDQVPVERGLGSAARQGHVGPAGPVDE